MKLTEYAGNINIYIKTNLRHLHGDKFYAAFDKAFNIPALEVQTSGTKNNMVSRKATNPEKSVCARTSGVFHFSSEKTRGAVERPSFFPGQGGFNPFSSLTPLPTLIPPDDKARTDHSGQPPIFFVVERKFENSSDNSFLEITHEVAA